VSSEQFATNLVEQLLKAGRMEYGKKISLEEAYRIFPPLQNTCSPSPTYLSPEFATPAGAMDIAIALEGSTRHWWSSPNRLRQRVKLRTTPRRDTSN
jgi:hypothetical protein